MEKVLIYVILALSSALFTLFVVAVALALAWLKARPLQEILFSLLARVSILEAWAKEAEARVSSLEAWVKEAEEAASEEEKEEEEARREKFADLGRKSQQVQAERKEMEAQAYKESMEAVKSGGTDLEAIKGSLRRVVEKYPQVAEGTARKLIRDLGYQRYEGIIMPLVAEWASKALAPNTGQGEQTEDIKSSW